MKFKRSCCQVFGNRPPHYTALQIGVTYNMNWEARKFLADLGRKISRVSGDDRETTLLFQRISVLLFRFNSVSLHNRPSFELDDRSEH